MKKITPVIVAAMLSTLTVSAYAEADSNADPAKHHPQGNSQTTHNGMGMNMGNNGMGMNMGENPMMGGNKGGMQNMPMMQMMMKKQKAMKQHQMNVEKELKQINRSLKELIKLQKR